jgi:hypothetical protein
MATMRLRRCCSLTPFGILCDQTEPQLPRFFLSFARKIVVVYRLRSTPISSRSHLIPIALWAEILGSLGGLKKGGVNKITTQNKQIE